MPVDPPARAPGGALTRLPVPARLLRGIEFACIAAGGALLLFFAGAHLDRELFRSAQAAAMNSAGAVPSAAGIDFSLWGEGRVAAYQESLGHVFTPPLATLRIPRIGLEVPVLAGTDDLTLNRAVGHIAGTPAPGEAGNVGIAGHRDGYFRGLKDVAVGDAIELEVNGEPRSYAIESIQIVDPKDVHVLAPTASPALTLVTCYPFYFVGKAPQRYIVRAEALHDAAELPLATGKR